MAFDTKNYLLDKGIKNVLHIGADRGNELLQYGEMGVEKVVWVEANPELYEELKINLRRLTQLNKPKLDNIENITCCQLIADVDKTLPFNIYYGPDAEFMKGNKGMSSLLTAKEGWTTPILQKTLNLPAMRLDHFLSKDNIGYDFQLLNIDTQGAELKILTCAAWLLECVDYINCEVTFDPYQYEDNPLFTDIQKHLWGFRFKHVHTNYSDGNRWGDAIFEKVR